MRFFLCVNICRLVVDNFIVEYESLNNYRDYIRCKIAKSFVIARDQVTDANMKHVHMSEMLNEIFFCFV